MQISVHKISVTGHCLISVGLVFLKDQDYIQYMNVTFHLSEQDYINLFGEQPSLLRAALL